MNRVVHFEIHASNPEQLIAFYSTLFGWKFAKWGEMPYWGITTGEDTERGIDGGLVPRRGAPAEKGQAVNAFVCTVTVASVDQTVDRALANGASMALPKMAIPSVGWLAYLVDPDGNIVGVMQEDPKAA